MAIIAELGLPSASIATAKITFIMPSRIPSEEDSKCPSQTEPIIVSPHVKAMGTWFS
jgi:hypothetical protein